MLARSSGLFIVMPRVRLSALLRNAQRGGRAGRRPVRVSGLVALLRNTRRRSRTGRRPVRVSGLTGRS